VSLRLKNGPREAARNFVRPVNREEGRAGTDYLQVHRGNAVIDVTWSPEAKYVAENPGSSSPAPTQASILSGTHSRWELQNLLVDSPLLRPLTKADLIAEWGKAATEADSAERDWHVLCVAHAKHGGVPPPETFKQRAESLRRTANTLRQRLWGW
jgi:hypothetical protein